VTDPLDARRWQSRKSPTTFNAARVRELHKAIITGRYRIDPDLIATRLIALETALMR
jgi:anti-sigma28 factor (negative regulator of flagellin synthesis)